jgi:hypothetical protein
MFVPILIFVGAVLIVNGIWIYGAALPVSGAAAAGSGGAVPSSGGQSGVAAAAVVGAARLPVESIRLGSREVGAFNLFIGVLFFIISMTMVIKGGVQGAAVDSVEISWTFALLFAFTYLWLAANMFIGADGRAFGWYCLFVAITAVPIGVISLTRAEGTWSTWFGLDWIAWGILWACFWIYLSFGKSAGGFGRFTGLLAIALGILTSWLPGFLLAWGYMSV